MLAMLASPLTLQAAPPQIRADYDCRSLTFRQEVRCDLEFTLPHETSDDPVVVRSQCVFARDRSSGRCQTRPVRPVEHQARARIEEILRTVEVNPDLYHAVANAGGLRFSTSFTLVAPAAPSPDQPPG